MTAPLVSVCIPTHNGEKYLLDTIKSVLTQTYANIEILISDQSSEDSTLRIINGLADQRFRVIQNVPKTGVATNWNSAGKNAQGKYVKLLCQDDLLKPTCIERQVDALERATSSSFCFSPRDIISPRGRRIFSNHGYKPKTNFLEFPECIPMVIRSGTNIFGEPCSVLMRATSFHDSEGFYGSYLIDLNMWLSLWRHGSAYFLNEPLSQFRISKSSWTSQLRHEQSNQVERLFKALALEHQSTVTSTDVAVGLAKSRRKEKLRHGLTQLIEFAHY